MDNIRLGPSSSADGVHAVRQKSGTETAQTSDAFFALLSGLGAQSNANMDAPASPEEPAPSAGSSAEGAGSLNPAVQAGTAATDGASNALDGTAAAEQTEHSKISGTGSAKPGAKKGISSDDGALSGVPAGSESAVAGDHRALKGKNQSALPEPGAPVLAQDAATPLTLALASGGLGAGGGVVAQTNRIDTAVAPTKIGAANLSTHRPLLASAATSASAVLSSPLRALAQVAGLTHPGAQGAGAVLLGNHIDPRALSETGQLQATSQKAVENGAASVSDIAGLVTAPLLPIEAAVSTSEFYRDRVELPKNERSGFGSTAVGQAWAESGGTAVTDAGQGIAGGMAASPENAVAEKVTYWLSENLKNAALTVEHAGQPVDVRVSLAGNEAHVSFHSDQAQTRELLTDSMEQLRELLRGEGLVLSGATVDTGTSGQTGDQGGRSAPFGAATTNVLAAIDTPVQTVRRTLTNSSVDLYV